MLRGSAISHLATSGFNPVFGARPVKRVIQRELETTLARSLLKGEFQVGGNKERRFIRVPYALVEEETARCCQALRCAS